VSVGTGWLSSSIATAEFAFCIRIEIFAEYHVIGYDELVDSCSIGATARSSRNCHESGSSIDQLCNRSRVLVLLSQMSALTS